MQHCCELWGRPAATALIPSLASELPYASCMALKKKKNGEFPGGLAVKDPPLSLWLGFNPWPGNFCMLQAWPKNIVKSNGNIVEKEPF